jgi:hypothetical protein
MARTLAIVTTPTLQFKGMVVPVFIIQINPFTRSPSSEKHHYVRCLEPNTRGIGWTVLRGRVWKGEFKIYKTSFCSSL